MHIDYFKNTNVVVPYAPYHISQFHYDLVYQANEIKKRCTCNNCLEIAQNFVDIAEQLPHDNQYELAQFYKYALLHSPTSCLYVSSNFTMFRNILTQRIKLAEKELLKQQSITDENHS